MRSGAGDRWLSVPLEQQVQGFRQERRLRAVLLHGKNSELFPNCRIAVGRNGYLTPPTWRNAGYGNRDDFFFNRTDWQRLTGDFLKLMQTGGEAAHLVHLLAC